MEVHVGPQGPRANGAWMSYEDASLSVYVAGRVDINGHVSKGGSWRDIPEIIAGACRTVGVRGLVGGLNGQFALVLIEDHVVHVVADHCAVVPLYWTLTGGPGCFCFAAGTVLSDLCQRMSGAGRDVVPDIFSLTRYILTGSTCASGRVNRTLVQGIFNVGPASGATIDLRDGRVDGWQYWTPSEKSRRDRSAAAGVDAIKTALKESLRTAAAYGRVGVELSSGMDSGVIAASLAEMGQADAACFAIKYPRTEVDESRWATATAERLGLTCDVVDVADRPVTTWNPQSVFAAGIPGDLYVAQQAGAVAAARVRQVRTLLTGVGADELFGLSGGPGYIWDLVVRGQLVTAARHGWSWAKKRASRSPDEVERLIIPPWVSRDLVAPISDEWHRARRVRGRMWAVRIAYAVNAEVMWSNWGPIYEPAGIALYHPYLTRDVIEAAMATPGCWLDNPAEYKWLLRQLAHGHFGWVKFAEEQDDLSTFTMDGILCARSALHGMFSTVANCELATLGVVNGSVVDYMAAYLRDPLTFYTELWDELYGVSLHALRTIEAELWLRGLRMAFP